MSLHTAVCEKVALLERTALVGEVSDTDAGERADAYRWSCAKLRGGRTPTRMECTHRPSSVALSVAPYASDVCGRCGLGQRNRPRSRINDLHIGRQLHSGGNVTMYPPSFTSFTNDQRKALLEGDQEIINRLHKCENVMRGDLFDAFDNLESLSDIMQYKFGGNIWRIGLLSQAFVNRVHTATALKLGIDSKPISCYRQQYTRRNRHLTLWGKLRRYVRRALAALL